MIPPILELEGATEEENRAAEVMVGECAKAVALLLRSRRRGVKVRGLPEKGVIQLIALSAVVERTLELYPPEVQEEIRALGLEVAKVIAR